MDSALRVAARHIRAQEDEAALDALVDHWADVFLDELAANTKITESDVEDILRSKGVEPDDLNALLGMRSAGAMDVIKALGGLVLRGVWYLVVHPFLALGKFVASSKFRTEVKRAFRKGLSHDVRATKHMLSVAGRLARGEEVRPEERKAAMRQLVETLSKAVLLYFAGPAVRSLFSGMIWKGLWSLLGPVEEILMILFNRPLRSAAAKLLSADIKPPQWLHQPV